jgi:hypothetical protein
MHKNKVVADAQEDCRKPKAIEQTVMCCRGKLFVQLLILSIADVLAKDQPIRKARHWNC